MTVAVLDPAEAAEPLDPADVDEVTYRGSGPGGQHRNTSDTCVRATHRPTGIVVHATASRSQWANRQAALDELARRVATARTADLAASRSADRADQIGDGGRGSYDWNWCAWRDEVVDRAGRRQSYTAALRGRFRA